MILRYKFTIDVDIDIGIDISSLVLWRIWTFYYAKHDCRLLFIRTHVRISQLSFYHFRQPPKVDWSP